MSGFQPWQVQAFMGPPGPSVPWLGQTEIPAGSLNLQPALPHPQLKEGTAAPL